MSYILHLASHVHMGYHVQSGTKLQRNKEDVSQSNNQSVENKLHTTQRAKKTTTKQKHFSPVEFPESN